MSKLRETLKKYGLKFLLTRMKMNTVEKKCTRCSEQKNRDEFINKCGMCRPCRAIHRKEYRQKNIERFKEKDRIYHEKHKNEVKIRVDAYYALNKTAIQAQRKALREKYPDRHRERQRLYYHANLNRRLSLVYRNRVRREVKSGKDYLEYLGCSIDHLKEWFEFNFSLDGFTWGDYDNKIWEIDHVTPCCKFDMKSVEDVKKCFNWKNTKPESRVFNRRKSGNLIFSQKLELELRLYIFQKQNNHN